MEGDESTAVSTKTTLGRLGVCEACGAAEAKYKCPGCGKKSCSSACVQRHKDERGCTGQRDTTAFKSVSNFSNLDLLSDYRLLEETARSVERARCDPLKFGPHFRKLPVRLSKLRLASSERGTRLLFLPDRFSRHLQNTTYYDWKAKIIKWRVEWHFPQANDAVFVDERLLEEDRLSTLVSKYLEPEQSGPAISEQLQLYQAMGLLGVRLLLKAESVERAGTRFHPINISHKLKAALKGKTVVEFPEIFVVLEEQLHLYELVPPGKSNVVQRELKRKRPGSNRPGKRAKFVKPRRPRRPRKQKRNTSLLLSYPDNQ